MTDDVTWPWKVKLVTPIRLERNISKTTSAIETSNLVCSFVSGMPSGRTNNNPESGRGLDHVTPTIFGSTVGYPSDSLASCYLSNPHSLPLPQIWQSYPSNFWITLGLQVDEGLPDQSVKLRSDYLNVCWSHSTNVADRQTDRRVDDIHTRSNTVLRTYVFRAVMTKVDCVYFCTVLMQ